jgi:RNA polymerase sigma-70 factor, ECF subfamily
MGTPAQGFARETPSATPPKESAILDAELRTRFEREAVPLLPALNRVARQLTRNAADADDLVQETMVRAYSGFIATQSQPHTKAWFIRIMRNVWIDDHRRLQRRPAECLTGDVGDWEWHARHRHAQETRDAVEAQLIGTAAEMDVRDAFRSLSKELRRALYYAYVEGLPYKDIAEREDIPLGTVMSRLYRARRQMRQLLAQRGSCAYYEPPDDAHVA